MKLKRVYYLLMQIRVRATLYAVVFFLLWGYRALKFCIYDPIDVLTSWGKVEFVPPLKHEDVILMIGRGRIMYAIFLISGFILIEAYFGFITKSKLLLFVLGTIFVLLAIAEMYWENNRFCF